MPENEAQERWAFAARFNAEDKPQIAAMQQGVKSRLTTAGPLASSDCEGCIWDFYHWMAARLLNQSA
ncbi:MAG: SRPBCC family protein [Paracoccaceae bacterium]